VDSLTTTISTLQSEVGELKSVVGDLRQSGTMQPFAPQVALPPVSTVASSMSHATETQLHVSAANGFRGHVMGRGGRGRRGRVGMGRGGLHDRGAMRRSVGTSSNNHRSAYPSESCHKVKVVGARRVWGH
jgi:hypothetical protein